MKDRTQIYLVRAFALRNCEELLNDNMVIPCATEEIAKDVVAQLKIRLSDTIFTDEDEVLVSPYSDDLNYSANSHTNEYKSILIKTTKRSLYDNRYDLPDFVDCYCPHLNK